MSIVMLRNNAPILTVLPILTTDNIKVQNTNINNINQE